MTKKEIRHTNTIIVLALCALLVAVCSGVGATYCAISASAGGANKTEYFDGVLREDSKSTGVVAAYPGYSEAKSAVAVNRGSQPMWVRMKLTRSWSDGAGNVVTSEDGKELNADLIEIGLNDTVNWQNGYDGWFYYQSTVDPGQETTSLMESITLSTKIGEENNDNSTHAVSSIYANKTADVDVQLQCSTSLADSNTASNYSSLLTKTGDEVPAIVYILISIALISIFFCIILLIIGRRRINRDK
jgi:hypothetical protein